MPPMVPTTTAAIDTTRLSVNHCRAMRAREAPIAIRTAISRRRSNTVASCTFATFAHAAASASAAASSANNSTRRAVPSICSGSADAGAR